jgi:uncharacterized protein (UPF0216 family)
MDFLDYLRFSIPVMIDIECGRICPIKISSKIEIKVEIEIAVSFVSRCEIDGVRCFN